MKVIPIVQLSLSEDGKNVIVNRTEGFNFTPAITSAMMILLADECINEYPENEQNKIEEKLMNYFLEGFEDRFDHLFDIKNGKRQ